MNDITTELIIHDYFIAKTIFGRFLDEKKFMRALGESYLLSEEQTERLYALAESVNSIKNVADYYRFLRVRQYNNMIGREDGGYSEELTRAIAIKGTALEYMERHELTAAETLTENTINSNISSVKTVNLLPVLRITGILTCLGIFFPENLPQGVQNLRKAAEWNDMVAFAPLIYFDEANRARNANLFHSLAEGTIYEELCNTVCAKYGITRFKRVKSCHVLNKVFETGKLKKDVYVSQFANVLYSPIIGQRDKEKLLLSENPNILSEVKNLPLRLSSDIALGYDCEALGKLPVSREAEREQITRALNTIDLRGTDDYQPICLYSESDYVLDSYHEAFGQIFADAWITHVNAADLSYEDVDHTNANIFVRSCNDHMANVYIIELRGEVNEKVRGQIINFLSGARRKKFHLNEIGITLDLSAVLPICFCDGENYRYLKEACDVVTLEKISAEERGAAFEDLTARKAAFYGVDGIEFGGETRSKLLAMDTDAAERVLDKAVRGNRVKGKKLTLTDEIMKNYWKLGETKVFGFGGNKR